MNLGNAFAILGGRETGTMRLQDSVDAYTAALEEIPREQEPLDWARTQMNLGNALKTFGEREDSNERLRAAIRARSAALKEMTRERVPLDWAGATGNQGLVRATLAERSEDAGMARTALDQVTVAESVLRDGGHIFAADTFARHIPVVQALVARFSVGG
jgi:hypothetical protein